MPPLSCFETGRRSQTQSSVKATSWPRQQMDVWFCIEAGTTAERHERELKHLKKFYARAPPKRVGRAFALLTRTYHGRRLTGSDPVD